MRAAVLIALLILAQNLAAKDPLGPEFRVNTSTLGNQGVGATGAGGVPPAPVAVAARDDGGSVVVWNQPADSQQGVVSRINAQLYGPSGSPEGAEFTIENGESSELDMAMAPDGAFVVIWRDFVSNHIEARRYTAAAQPAGEVLVVSDTASTQYPPAPCPRSSYISPRVAMSADGAFVVLWTCAQGSANFPGGAVFARYYDGDGIPADGYLTLGNFTTGSGFLGGLHADVLMATGGYLVVYQGPCRIMPGSDTYSAPCGQRFNTLGEAQGDPLPLGPQRPFGEVGATRPQAVRDAAGNFAVVWINEEARLVLGRYNADSAPLGDAFVFAAGETLRNLPAVAASGNGEPRFVVIYETVADAADGSGQTIGQIVAREFALDGSSPNGGFIAHSNTTADQRTPAATLDADGNYILAWGRREGSGDFDVFARRFGGAPAPSTGQLRFVVPDPIDPAVVVSEANGSVVVTVERVNGSAGAASAQVRLATDFSQDGEPLLSAPGDISENSQPSFLNWADGESGPQSVSFALVNDDLPEGDEQGSLFLDTVSGASEGSPASARLIVVDDDPDRSAGFTAASSSISQGGAPLTITAALSGPSGKDISLAYELSGTAQSGVDYQVSPLSPISIPAGQTEASIVFTPLSRSGTQPEKSVVVDLDFNNSINVAAGTQTRHTVTVAASDGAASADLAALAPPPSAPIRVDQPNRELLLSVINFGPDIAAAGTVRTQVFVIGGGRIVEFPSQGPVRCVRSPGLDSLIDCTLSEALAANQSREYLVTVSFPQAPGDYTLRHSVSGGPGDPNSSNNEARRSYTVRALDPGVVGFVANSSVFDEGAIFVAVPVARSGDGEGAASVGFQVLAEGGTVPATAGSDYAILSGNRLTFPEGVAVANVTIEIKEDDLPENLEGLLLELVDPVNTAIDPQRSRHELMIEDNDGGPGDRTPDAFTLSHDGGETGAATVAPGTAVITDPFEVRGIGGPATIAVDTSAFAPVASSKTAAEAPAAYSINGGAFTHAPGTVNNGDAVRLRVIAAQTAGDAVTATLTIGGVSASFTVVADAGSSTGGGAGGDSGNNSGGGATGAPLLCALLLALGYRRRLSAGRQPA